MVQSHFYHVIKTSILSYIWKCNRFQIKRPLSHDFPQSGVTHLAVLNPVTFTYLAAIKNKNRANLNSAASLFSIGSELTMAWEFMIFLGVLALLGILWGLKWRRKSKPKVVAYKVIKQIAKGQVNRKRVCAVVGGTGFVGSEVVNELIHRKEYTVYVLGRTFRPERTNPEADCLIQVDLEDFEGMVKAFQGVDSVINAAAFVPTAFSTPEEVHRINMNGFENLLKAVKKANVKNVVHVSGIQYEFGTATSPLLKAFTSVFYSFEETVLKANNQDGLRTCAVSPSNMVGLTSGLFKDVISGHVTQMPLPDKLPMSFMPVEYAMRAIVNVEAKLAAGDERVAGKALILCGEQMSWKTLFQLPTWPNKISNIPKWVLILIVKVNVFLAKTFGWAPFGSELSDAMIDFLDAVEAKYDLNEVQEMYDLLGVGPPFPPMQEYIAEIVKQYKTNQEKQKDK